MAIIEINTASDARKLLLALVALARTANKLPIPYPPVRATTTPTGVQFNVTQGTLAFEIKVDNAGADREGVLLFSADQIKALAATLAATDKRPWFDLWSALKGAHAPGPDWYFPPFEKVLELMGAQPAVDWACFDLALLDQVNGILALSTSIPPARILLRSVDKGVIVEAGPVRGVVMGCNHR